MSTPKAFGHKNLNLLTQELFSVISKHSFHLCVGQYDPALPIHHDHCIRCGFQKPSEFLFRALAIVFSLFAIIDVCKEQIPRGYLIFRILHRETANLEPSVNSIGTAAAVFNLVDLPRLDRLFAHLNYARKVIWMNRTDEGPVLQLLICLAEILQGLAVQKLHFAHCTSGCHEPRNVVDDLLPRKFSRPQGFLPSLAILDINTGSVPFEDVARLILQWIGANQEPSIGTIESANPSFRVNRRARSQTRLPLLDESLTVVRMNRFRPAPTLRLFRSHTCVIEPDLIEEVAVAVRTSSPGCCGDCIDDGSKVTLTCSPCLLRLLSILDIRACT